MIHVKIFKGLFPITLTRNIIFSRALSDMKVEAREPRVLDQVKHGLRVFYITQMYELIGEAILKMDEVF